MCILAMKISKNDFCDICNKLLARSGTNVTALTSEVYSTLTPKIGESPSTPVITRFLSASTTRYT